MRPALLLVDLQQDYLNRPGLVPAPAQLISNVAALLDICRQAAIPIYHTVTQIRSDGSDRMPHWKMANHWACVEGTSGVLPPAEIAALPEEAIFSKPFFNAFDNPKLSAALAVNDIDTLIVAGIYTHACVRATALDAYRRGHEVWIAADAVASADPTHARLTLEYLEGRAARCFSTTEIATRLAEHAACSTENSTQRTWSHHNPANWDEVLTEVPLGQPRDLAAALHKVHGTQKACGQTGIAIRIEKLTGLLESLTRKKEQLLSSLILEVGKPLTNAQAEFDFAIALLKHSLQSLASEDTAETGANFQVYHRPVGTIGLITPWNNPLAIPIGKLAPALAYGNAVVWKPALQATQTSRLVMECLAEAGLDHVVALVTGDADTGRALLEQPEIDAISFTGSVAVGRRVAAICAAQNKALQAELGGNNAAIIMADVDPESIAQMLAPAMFSFSGQRCTGIRRLIVAASIMARFESALIRATIALHVGDPADANVHVGPLISREQQARMATLTASGGRVLCGGKIPKGYEHGCWFEPTLITDVLPDSMLVQEESFGPVAVLMPAQDIEHALALNNSVRHGLVTALFTQDASIQEKVMAEAQSGIISINQCPLLIDAAAPFGGWKASGIGLPEHGRWDKTFYTKPQAVYGVDNGDCVLR